MSLWLHPEYIFRPEYAIYLLQTGIIHVITFAGAVLQSQTYNLANIERSGSDSKDYGLTVASGR